MDANQPLVVTLTAQQWNTVLLYLAEGPYRLVAPVMHTIQGQCERQDIPEPPNNVYPMEAGQ